MSERTYYETLGVTASASPAEIRDAYRRLARQHHPDQGGGRTATLMAEINEAYRVLSDPGRRAVYDAGLRGLSRVAAPPKYGPTTQPTVPPPAARPPARYPWKLALGMAAIGAVIVLVGAALYKPRREPPPDNILVPGSCVTIEDNGDAREINCTGGDQDLVVVTLVPADERCPEGLPAYRDRQGLGMACVRGTT